MATPTRRVRRALIVQFLVIVAFIVVGGLVVTWRTAAEPITIRAVAVSPGTGDVGLCNTAPDECVVSFQQAADGTAYNDETTWTQIVCGPLEPTPVVYNINVNFHPTAQSELVGEAESLPPLEASDGAPPFNPVQFPGQVEGETCAVSITPWDPTFELYNEIVGSAVEPYTAIVGWTSRPDPGARQDIEVRVAAGPAGLYDLERVEMPLAEWAERFAVAQPTPERSVPLTAIWGTVAAALIGVAVVGTVFAAQPLAAARRAEVEARAASDARRRFFTGNPDPVITVNRDGTIVEWSQAAAELLRVESLDGCSVHDFANTDRDAHVGLVEGFHDAPSARAMASIESNVTARLGDGTILPVDISLTQVTIEGHPLNVAVIRDASDRVKAAQTEAAEAQAAQAQQILSATHHELQREIVQVGFAIDDLDMDEGSSDLDLSDLTDAYARLEEGKDNVAALAQLGRDRVTSVSQTVRAESLVVLTDGMAVETHTVAPLEGVDRLLLRTLVKTVARNSEKHGGAETLRIGTTVDRLTLVDDGTAPDQTVLEAAWATGARPDGSVGEGLSIVRRVIAAHEADGGIYVNDLGGVTVWVQFKGAANP